MVRAIPVVLWYVFLIAVTIRMTVFYVKNYTRVKIGYPIAVLVLFTILVFLYSFPLPEIFGKRASDLWMQVTNGGYLVEESYSFLSPIGLGLLTIKLYCVSNLIVGMVYWIFERLLGHAEKTKEENRKKKAVQLRKDITYKKDELPPVFSDFWFISDIMPLHGIIEYNGEKIEIINNSGVQIPEGTKKIYARRIKDYKQIDSKSDTMQSDKFIPYIEIWAIEKIN